jgi:lipopolysaccharide export system protein LptA
MRSTRGFLLLAIAVILGAVGASYYIRKGIQDRQAPPKPEPLPLNTELTANEWFYKKEGAAGSVVEVRARNFRQVKDPDRMELEHVELRIFDKQRNRYDRIKSESAQLDVTKGTLYSDGDVEIITGLPAEAGLASRNINIRTSGLTYDSNTGKAFTDRPASFTSDRGEGKCVGASYDPNARELQMYSQVELHWRGQDPKSKPMKLESGHLLYKETEEKIYLSPWARLTRDTTVLDSRDAVAAIDKGAIRHVDATQAHGIETYPERKVEYAADQMGMDFDPKGQVEKIAGERNARLVSSSRTVRTTVTTDKVNLEFVPFGGESVLTKTLAQGHSVMEAVPVAVGKAPVPETRVLHSDVIELDMRPGGKEIESVRTHTPGTLEFLPNRPEQRRRRLDAERMTMNYAPGNVIQAFRATTVSTRTEPDPRRRSREPLPPVLTWSKDLSAAFDPKTGHLTRLEQWNDFRYEEGTRKAKSETAVLEEDRDLITLERPARIWDQTGSTTADKILLDQKNGDITAEGHVVSSRLPDKKGSSSAMLSQDDPLEGTADRMQTSNRNQRIHYESNAVVWQGPNRIRGDVIDIDRNARTLVATGNVRSRFVDRRSDPGSKSAPATPARTGPPTFITVDAAKLVYVDKDRLAHYTGGARLLRPGMDVKAEEIRAFLNDTKAQSSLDRAYADGKVEILRSQPDRTVRCSSEHAEYFTGDERIVLKGGRPLLVDSRRGSTRGQELTYFVSNDKLLVNGSEQQPVGTRLHRP